MVFALGTPLVSRRRVPTQGAMYVCFGAVLMAMVGFSLLYSISEAFEFRNQLRGLDQLRAYIDATRAATDEQFRKLVEMVNKSEELIIRSQQRQDELFKSVDDKIFVTGVKACRYGVATVIAPRFDKNGTEIEYWPDVIGNISMEIPVVAVLNRLGRDLNVTRITDVITPQDLSEPPDFDSTVLARDLKQKYNDSMTRVRWRSQIVLDFVRLVRYVSDQCDYVLWLEDDSRPPDNWYNRVVELTPKDPSAWLIFWLSKGMPAVLINSRFSDFLLQFCIHHFDDAPVDWLVGDATKLLNKMTKGTVKFPPDGKDIFGHRGGISTLKEAKVRPIF